MDRQAMTAPMQQLLVMLMATAASRQHQQLLQPAQAHLLVLYVVRVVQGVDQVGAVMQQRPWGCQTSTARSLG
jgi:hypothetical protein